MSSVTMFSIVEVGHGEDDRFIQFFKEVRAYFSKQPGFIRNQLYRTPNPLSTRRFMVVGTWESTKALNAATGSEEWKKLMAGHQMNLNPMPFEEVSFET